MDNSVISPEEKQQILVTYLYKKPPAYLCDPIERASDFFRIDAHTSIYL